jgi:hypothetical protein
MELQQMTVEAKQGEDAEAELGRRHGEKALVVEQRIAEINRGNNSRAFTEEELVYAAGARCCCGAGYAYPSEIGMHGAWHCSRILKGKAAPGSEHDGAMPFAFWSVRGENEVRAYGNTTRPKEGEE